VKSDTPPVLKRILKVSVLLSLVLIISVFLGLSLGSTNKSIKEAFSVLSGQAGPDSMMATIIWGIRFPRVMLATLVGAALSLGGLVFQALLRNPLAEPFILGISGGSAIGAILGILMGLSPFPGVAVFAFVGSMGTLFLVLIITTGESAFRRDSLLLAGVMVNAFCRAVIMFLISVMQESRLHGVLFWLMGDLSMAAPSQVAVLFYLLLPCLILVFLLARPMNLFLMGEETALSMGVNVRVVSLTLLTVTSFMISATVCQSGLIGFVGLVMPHLLRMILGPDHRILIPACILAGGSYMVLCDLLCRLLSTQGEMPVGVITAMIGAPLFIFLLQRSRQ
jgi:iron complex transport system permease protein